MGGVEALPFSLLVFVAGALIILNLWAVVDAKFATDHAAREAVRFGVEVAGADVPDPSGGISSVANRALADQGHDRGADVTIEATDGFRRCSRLRVAVETSVPAINIPFVGGFGPAFTIRAVHSELVDPARSGVEGEATCLG